MSGHHYHHHHHHHHHHHRPTTPQTRLKSSPKQGPLKATIPIESVTKEGSSLRDSISPETSPTTWIRSPSTSNRTGVCNDIVEYLFEQKRYENYHGRTSPSVYPRNDTCNNSSTIRRTSSLDSIHLKGLASRDHSFINRDKSTQTDIATSLDSIHRKLDGTDTIEVRLSRIVLRSRHKSYCKETNVEQINPTITTATTTHRKSPSSGGAVPKSSRSSDEGLNQEIESYIARSESDPQCDKLRQPTPEGRKAPVADLFRIANFPNPIVQVMPNYNSPDDSQGSSPDQDKAGITGSSPRINRFMARSPPDGVERVLSKSVPILKPIPIELAPPRTFFTLTPSSRSAFESLDKKIGGNGGEQQQQQPRQQESPIVPEHKME